MKRGTKQPEPKSENADSDVMAVLEVGEYLNCHYSTVYRLVQKRAIPAFRLGGSVRFRQAELKEWMARQYEEAAKIRLSRGPEDVFKARKPTARGRYKRKS